jgi:hypothetical protein
MRKSGAVVLVALACVGCSSLTSRSSRVPTDLVALAQQTKRGGLFMIEVDGSGLVTGAACDVDVATLPKECVAAADQAAPGGRTVGAEKEWIDGVTYYEVVKEFDGRSTEILLTADGKVAGREDELDLAKAPKDVVAAANAAFPQGEVVAVEKVVGPEALGGTEHHVKKKIDGEVLRISVLPDLKIGRVLRKIRAEFKAPRG